MNSVDFAQATEVTSHYDQEEQIYFLPPLIIGLVGVTDEGSEEHATFIIRETRCSKRTVTLLHPWYMGC